jgi:macrolide transport system ATP-binding/permease protein
VLVSHDRRLLSDVATNVLDLDPSSGGRPRRYGDGYAGYVAGRKAELARWTQQYDRYLVERQRLADDLSAAQNRLQSGWRPPKSTGKHQRATRASSVVRAVHRRIDGLAAHEVTEPNPPLRFQLPDLPSLPGVTLLRAEEVAVEGRVCTPASVALRSGERLLVTGPNGAGTSTLLAVLAGELAPDRGTAAIAATARLGLVAQESRSRDRRSARAVYDARLGQLRADGLGGDLVPIGAFGLLSNADLARPATELSMGQQRRLDLALALAARPTPRSWTSPPTTSPSPSLTNSPTPSKHIPAAIVIVSHDRQMRDDLAHWPTLALPERR